MQDEFIPIMCHKICLDTMSDVREFVKIVQDYDKHNIFITDGNQMRVNAKSIIGVLYSMEFDNIWIESDIDIYSKISKFVKE